MPLSKASPMGMLFMAMATVPLAVGMIECCMTTLDLGGTKKEALQNAAFVPGASMPALGTFLSSLKTGICPAFLMLLG